MWRVDAKPRWEKIHWFIQIKSHNRFTSEWFSVRARCVLWNILNLFFWYKIHFMCVSVRLNCEKCPILVKMFGFILSCFLWFIWMKGDFPHILNRFQLSDEQKNELFIGAGITFWHLFSWESDFFETPILPSRIQLSVRFVWVWIGMQHFEFIVYVKSIDTTNTTQNIERVYR